MFLKNVTIDIPRINDTLGRRALIGANPFSYQGQPISQNKTAGVILSNQTLVLQQISRQQAGDYSCAASNREGEGVSRALHINILCELGE